MATLSNTPQRSVGNAAPTARSDSLVELGKVYPRESVRFLELTLQLGGICGILIAFPSCALLFVAWERSALCERPLRLWLLVVALLHLVQTPLRLCCYRWLTVGAKGVMRSAMQSGETAEQVSEDDHNQQLSALVSQIVQTPAWRVNEGVSAVALGWLVVGAVWVGNASPTKECPEAYYLTVVVLATAGLRLFLSILSFRMIFRQGAMGETGGDSVATQPAPMTAERLGKLPSIRCSDAYCTRKSGSRCSVCLSDFQVGQDLRLLLCGHYFHTECVDPWLLKRCDCPLCRSTEVTWGNTCGGTNNAAPNAMPGTRVD